MRAILAELAGEDGLTDDQLAGRLHAGLAEVRSAARILCRQRKADFCWGHLVLPADGSGGKRAA